MTSRRSPPRRSSGSRAALALAFAVLLTASSAAPARAQAGVASPLLERHDAVEIDWAAGTVTAEGGAAADLRMPSADVARAGASRRAEASARERLSRALVELPLGGDRGLAPAAVARAVSRARRTGVDYQSNGGALVRVTARFVDWLEPRAAEDAPATVTLAVPAMHLSASPVAKLGDGERVLGAAVYRLGAPPAGVKPLPAKLDRAGHLVLEGKHAPSAEALAGGAALIYVGKVLR